MRDFTLNAYRQYIGGLISAGTPFFTFREFLTADTAPTSFVLLRHDVDRKPCRALDMARLESGMGVSATYYFRVSTMDVGVMKQIESLGHEIGYHYESLSDANGDFDKAYADFESRLAQFREIADISTISMHGSPFKPYDNRDMWRSDFGHKKLLELRLLGEIYLAIDYLDIAYIGDTGRNWVGDKANRRDKVDSEIQVAFNDSTELLSYMSNPHSRLVFQIHPERWTNSTIQWSIQLLKDKVINLIKFGIRMIN